MAKSPVTKQLMRNKRGISRHSGKSLLSSLSSFWRKHPIFCSSLFLLLVAALLSAPPPALQGAITALTTTAALPLYSATLLWHRLQWTLFTEGKARLQVDTDFFNISAFGTPSSFIQAVSWDTTLTDALVNEGNDVTQSFLVAQMASAGEPVLLQQGPASSWALRHWDMLAQIAEGRDVVLEGVRWQQKPLHEISRDRDRGGMLGPKEDTDVLWSEQPLSAFLASVFHPLRYLSWAGDLDLLTPVLSFNPTTYLLETGTRTGNEATRGRWLDWSFFHVVEDELVAAYEQDLLSDQGSGEGAQRKWHAEVSISHPGVAWQTSYEPHHRFLSQLQGSTSVTLFPPEAAPLLSLRPHIHRLHRQSQLPIEQIEVEVAEAGAAGRRRNLLAKLGFDYSNETGVSTSSEEEKESAPALPMGLGSSVTLQPGDSLYVPPFWLARLQSESLSLSLTAHSPSVPEALVAEVHSLRTPLSIFAEHSTEGRMFATKLFLGLLLRELHASSALPPATLSTVSSDLLLESFARSLYNERFRPLFPPPHLVEFRNDTLHPKGTKQKPLSFCPAFPPTGSPLGELLEEHRDALYMSARQASALFLQIGRAVTHKQLHVHVEAQDGRESAAMDSSLEISLRAAAVVRTVLGDYFELLARFAVGPKKTVYFIHDCLN